MPLKPTKNIWFNNELVPWESAQIHVLSYALHYGSAVFVMDLEDEGRLLQNIDITDVSTSNIVNSVPADLTVITADGTDKANYNGAMIYAPDLEGKITKINLTDTGTMYQSTTLFNAESNSDNGRYIYKKAQATINDGDLWLYF